MFVTGRIADMDILLGWVKYDAGGTTTSIALRIFSLIGNWGNRYLLIGILGLFFTIILYFLIKDYIDRDNKILWQTILLSPGLLIYSNSPTKETLFFYPAIIFIIIQCNYLISNSLKLFNIFFGLSLLILMYSVRGDQSFPYIVLFLVSLLIRSIYMGGTNAKLKIWKSIVNAFLISITFNFVFSFLFPEFIDRFSNIVERGFLVNQNVYRPSIFNAYNEPNRIFQTQFLALFPTVGEVLAAPYKLVILVDSIMIISVFIKSWSKLFILVDPYKTFKKITLIIFTLITSIYFSTYGIVGSVNLGSSQRLRINYIPISIIFPLILEKKIRSKKN